jgi:hypothetical protein
LESWFSINLYLLLLPHFILLFQRIVFFFAPYLKQKWDELAIEIASRKMSNLSCKMEEKGGILGYSLNRTYIYNIHLFVGILRPTYPKYGQC